MDLLIRNKRYDFFDEVAVNLRFDSVASSFSFSAFFDPLNTDHKVVYRPLAFYSVKVKNENETLITGTTLNNGYIISKKRELISISGYSRSGVIEDCEIPVEVYPLQFDGQNLKQIAERIIKPFGLGIVIDGTVAEDVQGEFDTTLAEEGQTVKSFLTQLAAQKNIILSHTPGGNLLFTRARADIAPVASFSEDQSSVSIRLQTNGQGMHSSITLQKQVSFLDDNAGEGTISNPYVHSFRPRVKTQSSGTDTDTGQATQNALANELKGIKLTIDMDRWEWLINGKRQLIRPNTIVSVLSPNNFIFKKTNFFVESVTFKGNRKAQTAQLICVVPEVYNQRTPGNIFLR